MGCISTRGWIFDMSVGICEGLMRCRLCRYVRGINELQAVWVYTRGD